MLRFFITQFEMSIPTGFILLTIFVFFSKVTLDLHNANEKFGGFLRSALDVLSQLLELATLHDIGKVWCQSLIISCQWTKYDIWAKVILRNKLSPCIYLSSLWKRSWVTSSPVSHGNLLWPQCVFSRLDARISNSSVLNHEFPGLHRLLFAYSFWSRYLGPILHLSMRGPHLTHVGPRARPYGLARPASDPASTITASWPLTLTLPRPSQTPASGTWCKLNKNRTPLGEWECLWTTPVMRPVMSTHVLSVIL